MWRTSLCFRNESQRLVYLKDTDLKFWVLHCFMYESEGRNSCVCFRYGPKVWGVVFYIWLKMSLNYRLCAYFRHKSDVLAVLLFHLCIWRTFCCLRNESEGQYILIFQILVWSMGLCVLGVSEGGLLLCFRYESEGWAVPWVQEAREGNMCEGGWAGRWSLCVGLLQEGRRCGEGTWRVAQQALLWLQDWGGTLSRLRCGGQWIQVANCMMFIHVLVLFCTAFIIFTGTFYLLLLQDCL